MKKSIFFTGILLVFLGGLSVVQAQELNLIVEGKNHIQQEVIDELYSPTPFEEFSSLEAKLQAIQNQLYYTGYLELQLIENIRKGNTVVARFDLGTVYNSVAIYGHTTLFEQLNYNIQEDDISGEKFVVVEIPILENTLNRLSEILMAESYPFSSLKLSNIRPSKKGELKADLVINKGQKRFLQDIKILGYENASKNHIKHFLKLKLNTPFNLEKIKTQMDLLDQLPFVAQKRPAEVLFSPDSTTLYLYLEKIPSNGFDGFLGFGTNDTNGTLKLDGYLDLKLVNNLNYGESFELYYKSDDNDQKILDVSLKMPYLFGTALGAEMNLNIFKKDSTFTTTQQRLNLNFPFWKKHQLALGIQMASSNALNSSNDSNVENFDSQFYNLNYQFIKRQKHNALFPIKQHLELDIAFGQRQTQQITQQQRIKILGNRIFNLNEKNSIFLKIHLEELQSETYILNELIRFGGLQSVRGFLENSLFATRLAVLCSEYRYQLGPGLYVHSVMDSGVFQNAQQEEFQLYGLGLGLGLQTAGGIFRITYANGNIKNTPSNLSNAKVHLSFTSTF